MQSSLLTILILLPLVGAVVAVGYSLLPESKVTHFRWIALIFSTLTFVVSLLLLRNSGGGGFVFELDVPWIRLVNAHYHVGVDGISLWLVILTTLLVPISVWSAWNAME